MLCKIADLIADIPETDDLVSRCREYLCCDGAPADVVIRPELYRRGRYDPRTPESVVAYLESAYQFYKELVFHNGFYLHASAVVYNGRAYLFSGDSGVGKTTHGKLWQALFPGMVQVINDDKPALRRLDGAWYAYGTPWCGKDGINANAKAPLGGLCFLKQADSNRIRRLTSDEAVERIFPQTIYKMDSPAQVNAFLDQLQLFLEQIPIYELENRPELAAAALSSQTMLQGALEAGL